MRRPYTRAFCLGVIAMLAAGVYVPVTAATASGSLTMPPIDLTGPASTIKNPALAMPAIALTGAPTLRPRNPNLTMPAITLKGPR